MALLLADGFDLYEDLDELYAAGAWNVGASGTPSINTTGGRYGGGCFSAANHNSILALGVEALQGSERYYAFAHYYEMPGAAANYPIIRGMSAGGTAIWNVAHNQAGDILVFNASNVQIGSTVSGALSASAWDFIEVHVILSTADGSNDGTIEVRVNGSLIVSLTGQDLGLGTDQVYAHFHGGSTATFNWRVDDVIVMDASGSTMNGFIGDCRIDTLIPSGDGGVTDWTGAFTDVDDPTNATDDDSGYIASSTVAQESRFDVDNLPIVPDDVWSVQVRARARKVDGGVRTFRAIVNSAGTEAVGPTKGLGTEYAWERMGNFDVDPDTTAQWDGAGVNAMQIGVEIVA